MTEYRVSPVSEFSNDLNTFEDLLDYIECYAMFSEYNPVNKDDVILFLRRIRDLANDMIGKTQQAGYGYFTEPSEVME